MAKHAHAKRSLSDEDIELLLVKPPPGQQQKASNDRIKWPGPDNLKELAQAVHDKRPFVTFTVADGWRQRFRIRYVKFNKNGGGTVFVKPDSTAFIPCGYFSMKELKAVLREDG